MTWTPRGTVYGVLLNHASEWDAFAAQMHDAPYKAPPRAPVLYVKTANTFSPAGADIPVPADVPELEIGATVGLVMGAGGQPAQAVLLADLCVPHASVFRPPVRTRCSDGLLGIGVPVSDVDPASVVIDVLVDGAVVQQVRFDALRRPPAQLLAGVLDIMDLAEGDVLMLGCAASRPRVRAGQRFELRGGALGSLSHTLVAEAA